MTFVKCKLMVVFAVFLFVHGASGAAESGKAVDKASLDKAFEALKSYKFGTSRKVLKPIDEAVTATHENETARKELEIRLAGILDVKVPYAAKDYVCRKLSLIGSAECVPQVAPLLLKERISHMARYVLERIKSPKAVKAMREALPKAKGLRKIGIINSLGVRRDEKSVPQLAELLKSSGQAVQSAAASALGALGTQKAASALAGFHKKAPKALKLTAADARLQCAEHLLEEGKKNKAEAIYIYKALASQDQPIRIRRAALRGLEEARKE